MKPQIFTYYTILFTLTCEKVVRNFHLYVNPAAVLQLSCSHHPHAQPGNAVFRNQRVRRRHRRAVVVMFLEDTHTRDSRESVAPLLKLASVRVHVSVSLRNRCCKQASSANVPTTATTTTTTTTYLSSSDVSQVARRWPHEAISSNVVVVVAQLVVVGCLRVRLWLITRMLWWCWRRSRRSY